MSANDQTESVWKHTSCRRFIFDVMRYQPGLSSDLTETLIEQLVEGASNHAEFAREMYGDPEIVSRAIDYLGHIQDGPWQGIDWFKTSLSVVMELAVPNVGMNSDSILAPLASAMTDTGQRVVCAA